VTFDKCLPPDRRFRHPLNSQAAMIHAWRQVWQLLMLHVFLGCVLLLLAAACLGNYFTAGQPAPSSRTEERVF
jgi:hypothetical protein